MTESPFSVDVRQKSVTVAAHRFNNDLRYREGDHEAQTQFTPDYVLNPIRSDLGDWIELDPCTTSDNPVGAARFYTIEDDGLRQSWLAESIFVNPPYSKAREPWVEHCIAAGTIGEKVVLLIPAATDTRNASPDACSTLGFLT